MMLAAANATANAAASTLGAKNVNVDDGWSVAIAVRNDLRAAVEESWFSVSRRGRRRRQGTRGTNKLPDQRPPEPPGQTNRRPGSNEGFPGGVFRRERWKVGTGRRSEYLASFPQSHYPHYNLYLGVRSGRLVGRATERFAFRWFLPWLAHLSASRLVQSF